jgi:hypothetical protein
MTLLDLSKRDVAEAVTTIAPAVPPALVDAMAAHLALFPREARQLAAVRLAEALQLAADEHGEHRDRAAGVSFVALDAAIRRLDGAVR